MVMVMMMMMMMMMLAQRHSRGWLCVFIFSW
jgi:hypothetical protein